jgi:hypothetical protein
MNKKIALASLFILLLAPDIFAQCSMCRFAAESSYAGGSDIGKGLNNGILYIMGLPYLILLVLGVLLFRKPIKEKLASIN